MLEARCWMRCTGGGILDAGCWMVDGRAHPSPAALSSVYGNRGDLILGFRSDFPAEQAVHVIPPVVGEGQVAARRRGIRDGCLMGGHTPGESIELEVLLQKAVDGGMRLHGMHTTARADGKRAFKGGESDVGSDVDDRVSGPQEGLDEGKVVITGARVEPELPGKIGRMKVEPETADSEGKSAAPAGTPKPLRDEKAERRRVPQQRCEDGAEPMAVVCDG